jgi:hypothetical protein
MTPDIDWQPGDLCMFPWAFYPVVYVGPWEGSKRKWVTATYFGYPGLPVRRLRAELTRPTPEDISRIRQEIARDWAEAHDYYARASAALDDETKRREVAP